MTPPTSVQTVTAEDLLDRLQNPLWVHSTAPFESPQLSKEETLVDLLSAASEIATLTSSLTAAEARLRELEARLRAITNPSALAGSQAAKMIDPALGPLTPITMVVTKGQLQDAPAALSQTEEGL